MRAGTLVKWQDEGKEKYGVVCNEVPGCSVCAEWETPVHPLVGKGLGIFQGMPTESLTVVGSAPAELLLTTAHIKKVCQPGCGERTCKYLVVSPEGVECAKGSAIGLVWSIEFNSKMKSKGDNCLGKMGTAHLP